MTATTRAGLEFDITGDLPTGTTILEASAGTGKTWAIAALVARYVADGVPLEELLVVTFGRAATEELRERVRERLIRSEALLLGALDGRTPTVGLDRLDRLLLGQDGAPGGAAPGPARVQLQARHRRFRDALGAFDDATIATIHQFCHSMLRSLGVAGDTDVATTLVEDLTGMVEEVVDDRYLARYRTCEQAPLSHRTAREIARVVTADPAARVGPLDADPRSEDGERVSFAQDVVAELALRKRRLGVLSYDDLLADLAHALADSDGPARARMSGRWSVVLVDEFQDTDPVQWQVVERAFHGVTTLVLIGDPKQAIYAFRGGDINTYLRARALAGRRLTLATNRRSDGPLVAAISAGLGGMGLGHPEVVVHPVDASRPESRLAGLPTPQPWRLRVGTRATFGADPDQLPRMPVVRPVIAADCAADIAAVLGSGATFDGRPLRPGDIAVLCHTSRQLHEVRDALHRIAIPAVLTGDESVFASPAARWWLMLLEAMEQPNRSRRVRTAALTPFIGRGIDELDEGGDDLTDAVAARLRRWAELFALRGMPAVLAAAQAGGVSSRLLREAGGERQVTDVQHLAELLHDAALQDRLGLSALTAWLRRELVEDALRPSRQRSRRLESDAAAVQLATIHASKGLQFPIVYAPFLADRFDPWSGSKPKSFVRYHDEGGDRMLDISADPQVDVVTRAREEDDGESLRLLYVALTRAQSQLITWWAPMTNTPTSPLHRALVGRGPQGSGIPEARVPVPSDKAAMDRFVAWGAAGGPAPERMDTARAPAQRAEPASPARMTVRPFTRHVDVHWRRTSYSALTRAADAALHPLAPAFEAEAPVKDDEAPAAEVVKSIDLQENATHPQAHLHAASLVPSPMADLPVGNVFGSLVHAVLEEADPEAADLRSELARRIAQQITRWPLELSQADLADALLAVCHSPLGPLLPGVTLAHIPRRDRLCEMDFEMPLVGGDRDDQDRNPVLLGDLAPLLRTHLQPGDPLLGFARALDAPDLGDQPLRGYLTGSVDVVLRVGDRFLVVDYKTNWLGPPDARLTAAHYGPGALVAAMQHSSYPLQALLYAVVLHRFLRWRVPGYDPGHHLGGVLYLYLRGMCGPDTPVIDGHPTGVFSWSPPPVLVEAVSALLDGQVQP